MHTCRCCNVRPRVQPFAAGRWVLFKETSQFLDTLPRTKYGWRIVFSAGACKVQAYGDDGCSMSRCLAQALEDWVSV